MGYKRIDLSSINKKEAVSKVNLFVILSPSTAPVLSLPKRSGQAQVEISNFIDYQRFFSRTPKLQRDQNDKNLFL